MPPTYRQAKDGQWYVSNDNSTTWDPTDAPGGGDAAPAVAVEAAAIEAPEPEGAFNAVTGITEGPEGGGDWNMETGQREPVVAPPAPVRQPPPEQNIWQRALTGMKGVGQDVADFAGDAAHVGGEYASDAGEAIGEGALDTARGAAQGATYGFGEEIASRLVPEIDDGTGIPREYAAGSAQESMQESMRAANQESRDRSPVLYGGGEILGMAPSIIASGGGSTASAPLAARVLANAKAGATISGISATGHSEADNVADRLWDGLEGAETGAAFGGGLTGAGALFAKAAGPVGEYLGAAANQWRGKAAGGYGAMHTNLERQRGPGYIAELGEFAEQQGLHKRPGSQSRLGLTAMGAGAGTAVGAGHGALSAEPGGRWEGAKEGGKEGLVYGTLLGALAPSGPATYAANARPLVEKLGNIIGQSVDDATQQVYGFPKSTFIRQLSQYKGTIPDNTTAEASMRRIVDGLIAKARKHPDEYFTPRQLQGLKDSYKESAGFPPHAGTPMKDARAHRVHRGALRVPRNALETTMTEQALPETSQAYLAARPQYGMAKDVAGISGKRASQESGNAVVSLPAMASGHFGGGVGYETMKRYGSDIAATALRGGQRTAEGVGSAGRALGASGRSGQFAGGASTVAGEETTEQQLDRMRNLVERDPEMFGEQADAVRQAIDSGDLRMAKMTIVDALNRMRGSEQ